MKKTTRTQYLLKAKEAGAVIIEERSGQRPRYEPRTPKDQLPWVVYEPDLKQEFRLRSSELRAVVDDPDGTGWIDYE